MVKMAIYTQKCEQNWLKINNRGVGIKMSWVEKYRKINNRGEGGRLFGTWEQLYNYSGLIENHTLSDSNLLLFVSSV